MNEPNTPLLKSGSSAVADRNDSSSFDLGSYLFLSLLSADKLRIALAILFVSSPTLFLSLELMNIEQSNYPVAVLLERGFVLTVMFIVWRKWLPVFRKETETNDSQSFSLGRLLLWGYLYWGLLLPPSLLVLSNDPALSVFALFLLLPILVLMYRFFFYVLPLSAGEPDPRTVLLSSSEIVVESKLLPLRILALPVGLYVLFISLVFLGSPDGRESWVPWLLALAEGSMPVILAYHGLAQTLAYAPQSVRERYSLLSKDQLWEKHFRPKIPLDVFSFPKVGLLLLLLGVSLSVMNSQRAAELPPAVEMNLLESTLTKEKASLLLDFSDSEYDFRGFDPRFLRLTWASGADIAIVPDLNERKEHSSESRKRYLLEFHVSPEAAQEMHRNEVWLWYRSVKLFQVKFPDEKPKEPDSQSH